VKATGDDDFERDTGTEILVETARLWRSLGHYDLDAHFRIDGVTGPDEYSAIADNNVYTNLMAQKNLYGAADACQRHQDKARELGVTPEEMAAWRAAADRVVIPYDDKLGVHQQSEGFTQHEPWNFAATKEDQYPLLLHFAYFDLYRKQVIKQPDLILAMQLCASAFTPEQRARNFDYYERITVRDSSLSACIEAVAAADAGHLRLAFDYAAEAALMDLRDFERNARDGLHVASLGGTWFAFVGGFGGMRDHGDVLEFAPRLPDGLTRLAFSLRHRGRRLHVDVTTREAKYSLAQDGDGQPLGIAHHGERLQLTGDAPIVRPIPSAPERQAPSQPPGREPRRRSPGGAS
jgi:alpha,alpha-trehalose phosphorylase